MESKVARNTLIINFIQLRLIKWVQLSGVKSYPKFKYQASKGLLENADFVFGFAGSFEQVRCSNNLFPLRDLETVSGQVPPDKKRFRLGFLKDPKSTWNHQGFWICVAGCMRRRLYANNFWVVQWLFFGTMFFLSLNRSIFNPHCRKDLKNRKSFPAFHEVDQFFQRD